jgi:hypothetical protein
MVTMVLLKEERICAAPFSMLLRSRRRLTTFFAAELSAIFSVPPLLLLVRNGLLRALAGAGVGLGALSAHGQTLAVTDAAVAADLVSRLMFERNFTAEVALDRCSSCR